MSTSNTRSSAVSQGSGEVENKYFAAQPAEKAVPVLRRRAESWFDTLTNNNYLDKVKRCWLAHNGAYFDEIEGGHSISFGGEQGELVNLPVNHFRNIAEHILVMVTANRPSFQARSTNGDYKSLVQTKLANNLLDYYMRSERLEDNLKSAVEQAVVMGSGFIKMGWNADIGEEYDRDEETGIALKQGDVQFENLSVFDVVFDSTKESSKLDWVITRTWKNKFDIAATYPELEDEIVKLETKSEVLRYNLVGSNYDRTVDVPMYEFYHKRSESLPNGRYILYLEDDIVLYDGPMPYRDLPVYRISPSDILGTPYGYTSMFDLLPLQDALNTLYSTALTNQNAFGVQSILNPRGSDINIAQISGLSIIDYNAQAGKPESLQLTDTPAEVFNYMRQLIGDMETLSGVNAVARGNPESSLTSGNALALIQAQSLQFISGLQQSYIRLIEDVGTGLINMLKDFAAAPRVAAIVGKANRTEMKEFIGDDLATVNRVIVDVGNALSNTTAGRVQMAEQIMQMMPEKLSPEQYIEIMNTGRLDSLTSTIHDELLLIKSENERLTDGEQPVLALATDDHALHIREHRATVADPDLRQDADLVQRTLDHMQEHIQLLREADPDMLAFLGQQPLGPPAGSAVSPENAAPGQAPQGAMGGLQAQPTDAAAAQFAANGGTLPQPAQPAQAPGGAPVLASDKPLGG